MFYEETIKSSIHSSNHKENNNIANDLFLLY